MSKTNPLKKWIIWREESKEERRAEERAVEDLELVVQESISVLNSRVAELPALEAKLRQADQESKKCEILLQVVEMFNKETGIRYYVGRLERFCRDDLNRPVSMDKIRSGGFANLVQMIQYELDIVDDLIGKYERLCCADTSAVDHGRQKRFEDTIKDCEAALHEVQDRKGNFSWLKQGAQLAPRDTLEAAQKKLEACSGEIDALESTVAGYNMKIEVLRERKIERYIEYARKLQAICEEENTLPDDASIEQARNALIDCSNSLSATLKELYESE